MDKGGRGIDMLWVMVVGGYNSVGTKLVFNTQAKISGAISIAFSEFMSPQNKGEVLQQQDHGKKRYGHMRTHAHTHVYTNVCMNISICIQRESQQGCESQSASRGTKEARKKKEDKRRRQYYSSFCPFCPLPGFRQTPGSPRSPLTERTPCSLS